MTEYGKLTISYMEHNHAAGTVTPKQSERKVLVVKRDGMSGGDEIPLSRTVREEVKKISMEGFPLYEKGDSACPALGNSDQ